MSLECWHHSANSTHTTITLATVSITDVNIVQFYVLKPANIYVLQWVVVNSQPFCTGTPSCRLFLHRQVQLFQTFLFWGVQIFWYFWTRGNKNRGIRFFRDSPFEQFVMVLMKLCLNLGDQDLAYRFGIHQSTVSCYFNKWLDVLHQKLSIFVCWPERDQLMKTMLMKFRKNFRKCTTVLRSS